VIKEPVTVRLELESHPENVALVRSALTGIAEALGLGEELTADLKTALSEACNNVALHAYDGGSGPMIVEIDASRDGVSAAVVDRGSGITRISGGEDRMGLGLAVISALASSSEFRHPEGGGTEVRMWFRKPGNHGAEEGGGGLSAHRFQTSPSEDRGDNEILVSFAPPTIVRFVLGRMVQSLAASSHFSITKISDLRVANEAIAGYIECAADDEVTLAISTSIRRLFMKTGPMPAHDADTAREVLGTVVDRLEPDENSHLSFELRDSSREQVN
jgi:serine/threonine-protein kinase RsbW